MSEKKIRPLEGFSFNNESHVKWLNTYLAKAKTNPIVEKHYFGLFQLSVSPKKRLQNFFIDCKNSADGREIWLLMHGAWGKRSRREKQKRKGKKQYNFELTIEFGQNLQALATKRGQTQQKVLEELVNGSLTSMLEVRKLQETDRILSLEATANTTLEKELGSARKKILELESKIATLKKENLHKPSESDNVSTNHHADEPLQLTLERKGRSIIHMQPKDSDQD